MEIKDIGKSSGTVYHYTKLTNLTSIITKDGIIFHAGRYDTMNDPQDSIYGISIPEKMLKEWVTAVMEPNIYDISPYIVSFCKDNDKAFMWRLYDAEVTLHIDSEIVRKHSLKRSKRIMMDDVAYLQEDEIADKVIKMFSDSKQGKTVREKDFNAKAKASFIKCVDFREENEWRIAWFDCYDSIDNDADRNDLKGDKIASSIKSKGIKYGCFSFYRELKFPKECLKGITLRIYDVNRRNHIWLQLRTWLASCGYDITKINIDDTKTQPIR